jgi:hypothetical protein
MYVSYMGTHPNPQAQRLAVRLRKELDARNWGARTLARKLAGEPKGYKQVEHLRTQIRAYLRGEVSPSPERRREMAVALGLREDALDVETLDEEEDALLALYGAIRRTLEQRALTGEPGAVCR